MLRCVCTYVNVCVGTRACVSSCICAVRNNFFCRAAPWYVDFVHCLVQNFVWKLYLFSSSDEKVGRHLLLCVQQKELFLVCWSAALIFECQATDKVQKAKRSLGSLCEIMSTFFSSKKSHEDTKDKEPALEVKEEKSGVEGMYTPLCALWLVDQSDSSRILIWTWYNQTKRSVISRVCSVHGRDGKHKKLFGEP